jgi:hypothetical protein
MFVRFQATARRLSTRLLVAQRRDGRVRHEYIGSLGSISLSPSPAERIAFWTRLHQRLDALSNRVDATERGAVMAAIHSRIPMPTMDEHQAVQRDHAEQDVKFWQQLTEAQADDIAGHKGLLATTERAIAEREKAHAETTARAQAAEDRLVRVEQGEAVAVPRPMTRAEFLRAMGMTEAQAQYCIAIAEIAKAGAFDVMTAEMDKRKGRAERATVRKLHRVIRGKVPSDASARGWRSAPNTT